MKRTALILLTFVSVLCMGALTKPTKQMTTTRLWQGYHGDNCSFSRTNTAMGAFAADSTCTFTEMFNVNMGTVTSKLSGSDPLPGIVFTPVELGWYEICAGLVIQGTNTATVNLGIQITNNAGTVVGTGMLQTKTTGQQVEHMRVCGFTQVTALSAHTFTIEGSSGSGALTIVNSFTGTRPLEWMLKKL